MAYLELHHNARRYRLEYGDYGSVTTRTGKVIPFTTQDILHPEVLRALGVEKPLDIAEELWKWANEEDRSENVTDFINRSLARLTDGCFSARDARANTLDYFIERVEHFLRLYTIYSPGFKMWTSIWRHLDNSTSRNGQTYVLLEQTGTPEEVYELVVLHGSVYATRVTNQVAPSFSAPWKGVKNYSFKMDPETHNFFRTDKGEYYRAGTRGASVSGVPMFGLELEISSKVSFNELQTIVCDVEPKQEPFFIAKQDGSITGEYVNQYELVTVPCSPRYLKKNFSILFKKLDRLAKAKGGTLGTYFDLSTDLGNGIHIHIDRRSFRKSRNKTHISKLVSVLNLRDTSTFNLLSRLSMRPRDYRVSSYCSVDTNLSRFRKGPMLMEAARTGHRGATSLRQRSTVEIRLFQGIFDINHVRKCIDMTQALLDYTEFMPLSACSSGFSPSFTNFVLKSGQYNNLRKEMKLCA